MVDSVSAAKLHNQNSTASRRAVFCYLESYTYNYNSFTKHKKRLRASDRMIGNETGKCGSSSVAYRNTSPYNVVVGDNVSKQRDVRYIGLNVYYVRKKVLGVSQEEFGYMVGMSKDTVSNIERGIYIPNVHNLVRIANRLEIPVDFFLYEISEESLCVIRTN